MPAPLDGAPLPRFCARIIREATFVWRCDYKPFFLWDWVLTICGAGEIRSRDSVHALQHGGGGVSWRFDLSSFLWNGTRAREKDEKITEGEPNQNGEMAQQQ